MSSRRAGRSALPSRGPARGAGPTVLDVLRLRAESLLAGHAAGAELALLQQRERLAARRMATEGLEEEERVARELRARGAALQRAALKWAIEREALLLELERLHAQRACLRRELARPAAPQGPVPALPPPVQVALEDRQVEALALRFVSRLGQLDPADAGSAWARWKQALSERYPANVVAEVVRHAEQLLDLLG